MNEEIHLENNGIYEILNHSIRRKNLHLIYINVEISYSDLIKEINVIDGTLNFHLKKLEPLLKRSSKGNYMLSSVGISSLEIMRLINKKIGNNDNDIITKIKPVQFELIGRRVSAFLMQ